MCEGEKKTFKWGTRFQKWAHNAPPSPASPSPPLLPRPPLITPQQKLPSWYFCPRHSNTDTRPIQHIHTQLWWDEDGYLWLWGRGGEAELLVRSVNNSQTQKRLVTYIQWPITMCVCVHLCVYVRICVCPLLTVGWSYPHGWPWADSVCPGWTEWTRPQRSTLSLRLPGWGAGTTSGPHGGTGTSSGTWPEVGPHKTHPPNAWETIRRGQVVPNVFLCLLWSCPEEVSLSHCVSTHQLILCKRSCPVSTAPQERFNQKSCGEGC